MASKKRKKRAARVVRAWAGFCDGKLHSFDVFADERGDAMTMLAVYRTRAIARRAYEDFRRVEIREVRRP